MAILDQAHDTIVLRIVYDGPALSGKTTTVRSLASALSDSRRSEVMSPEELEGRTMYFDWLDYIGGLFDGRQVRCQIVSVAGQPTYFRRRQLILETADAVVYVFDSRRQRLAEARRHLETCLDVLSRLPSPPVGVVLQANKRDLEDVASRAELESALLTRSAATVVESRALDGVGVRESFVFAVRLALDRARSQLNDGSLLGGSPAVESGEDLLQHLRRREAEQENAPGRHETVAAQSFRSLIEADERVLEGGEDSVAAGEGESPRLPHPGVPTGLVWPPVTGRALLHRLHHADQEVEQDAAGNWWAVDARFVAHSSSADCYEQLEDGRQAVVESARLHSGLVKFMSQGRCLALSPDGRGRWRLWQVAARHRSMLDQMLSLLDRGDTQEVHRLIERCVSSMKKWSDAAVDHSVMPLSLATMSADSDSPLYVGIVGVGPEPRPESEVARVAVLEDALSGLLGEPGRGDSAIRQAEEVQAVDAARAILRQWTVSHAVEEAGQSRNP